MFTRDGLLITGHEHSADLHSEGLQWKQARTVKLQKKHSVSVSQLFGFMAWVQQRIYIYIYIVFWYFLYFHISEFSQLEMPTWTSSLKEKSLWATTSGELGTLWYGVKWELFRAVNWAFSAEALGLLWHQSLLILEQPTRKSASRSCDLT